MSATTTLPNVGQDGVRPGEEAKTRNLVVDDTLVHSRRFAVKVREVAVKVRGFFGRAWRWTKNKAAALFQAGQEAARATWDKAIVPAARWVGSNVGAAWEWLRPARSWVTTPLRAGATVAAAGFAYLATGPGVLLLALPILTYVLVAGATRTKPIIDGEVAVPADTKRGATAQPTVQASDGLVSMIDETLEFMVDDELHLNQDQVNALTARIEYLKLKMIEAFETNGTNGRKKGSIFAGRRRLAIIRRAGGNTPPLEVWQQFKDQTEAALGKAETNRRYVWTAVREGCLAEVVEVDALIEQHKETTK